MEDLNATSVNGTSLYDGMLVRDNYTYFAVLCAFTSIIFIINTLYTSIGITTIELYTDLKIKFEPMVVFFIVGGMAMPYVLFYSFAQLFLLFDRWAQDYNEMTEKQETDIYFSLVFISMIYLALFICLVINILNIILSDIQKYISYNIYVSVLVCFLKACTIGVCMFASYFATNLLSLYIVAEMYGGDTDYVVDCWEDCKLKDRVYEGGSDSNNRRYLKSSHRSNNNDDGGSNDGWHCAAHKEYTRCRQMNRSDRVTKATIIYIIVCSCITFVASLVYAILYYEEELHTYKTLKLAAARRKKNEETKGPTTEMIDLKI